MNSKIEQEKTANRLEDLCSLHPEFWRTLDGDNKLERLHKEVIVMKNIEII